MNLILASVYWTLINASYAYLQTKNSLRKRGKSGNSAFMLYLERCTRSTLIIFSDFFSISCFYFHGIIFIFFRMHLDILQFHFFSHLITSFLSGIAFTNNIFHFGFDKPPPINWLNFSLKHFYGIKPQTNSRSRLSNLATFNSRTVLFLTSTIFSFACSLFFNTYLPFHIHFSEISLFCFSIMALNFSIFHFLAMSSPSHTFQQAYILK